MIRILSFVLTLFALNSGAATYYVATTGSDSADGSSGTPWLTIQKAATTMAAGDTAVVASGTYTNSFIATSLSGTSGNPIRFTGVGYPVIGGFRFLNPYINVDGFSIRGTNSTTGSAITAALDGCNLSITNCIFEQTPSNVFQLTLTHGEYGVRPSNIVIQGNQFLDAQYHSLNLQGHGHTVSGNYWRATNGWDAIRVASCNTVISDNVMTNWSNLTGNANHPDLIQAFSNNGELATNVVVERNIFLDCVGTQIGNISDDGEVGRISQWTWRNNLWSNVEGAMNIFAPQFRFYNNTFYRSGTNTGAPILFRYSANSIGDGDDGEMFNNIFVECGSNPASTSQGWYSVDASTTGFVGDFNLVIGTGAGTTKTGFTASGREANGINGSDPLFINSAGGDYRLQAGSPARGAGTNLTALGFSTDIAGTARGTSWDMGAYQSSSGTPQRVINAVRAVIQSITQ